MQPAVRQRSVRRDLGYRRSRMLPIVAAVGVALVVNELQLRLGWSPWIPRAFAVLAFTVAGVFVYRSARQRVEPTNLQQDRR